MYSSDASSAVRTFADRPHVRPPRRPYPRVSRRQLLTSLILSLWLLADMLGGWIFLIPQAYAAKGPSDPPAKVTFHTFLNDKRPTHVYHGPLVFPRTGPTVPHDTNAQGHGVDMAHLLHSNGLATMQPISHPLDASLLVGAPAGGAPLDLKGSDGHLELIIQPGSLDFSHLTPGQGSSTSHSATATPTPPTPPTATSTATSTPTATLTPTPSATPGSAPGGPFTLQLSQLKGHFAAEMNLLCTSQLQVVDAKGKPVLGIRLTSPLTIIYHYQPGEREALALDPSGVPLSWTGLLSAARAAGQPTTGLVIPLAYDPHAHTLSGQSTVLGAGPLVVGGPTANQSPPIPILASVLGNSGQLGLSYPIALPPNARGFLPSLSLSYSSADTNQRTTPTSPADMVGDGWSLGIGSITAAEYPSGGSAGPRTREFLSHACTTNPTIRAWAVKQIVYGQHLPDKTQQTIAGTVDFSYHAPYDQSPWVIKYPSNYNCFKTPPDNQSTNYRCDDPIDKGTAKRPLVMSTYELDTLTSYVGDDSSSSHAAYRYAFSYQDYPFYDCNDPYTLVSEYCAGKHLLTSITPSVYQNGTRHQLKAVTMSYTRLDDHYYDGDNKTQDGSQQYGVSLTWHYLTDYQASNTGVGDHISYMKAFNTTPPPPPAT